MNKQAQEVTFSRKVTTSSNPKASLNNVPVFCASFQKQLRIYLDENLNFNNHIKEEMAKSMKEISALKGLRKLSLDIFFAQYINHLYDLILTMVK